MTVSPKTFWVGLTAVTVAGCVLFVLVFYPRDVAYEEKLAYAAERLVPVNHAERGLELYGEGKLRAAEKQYRLALAAAEELSQPRYVWQFRHATILYELGEYAAALEAIDRALEAKTALPGFLNTRGVILMKLGDYEGAEQVFTRVIQSDPEWWVAYVNRAAVKMEREDLDGALQDLTAVIESVENPGRAPRALLRRGAIFAKQGRIEDAEADFSAVVDAAEAKLAERGKSLRNRIAWRETLLRALTNRAQVRDAMSKPVGARRDRERVERVRAQLEALRAGDNPSNRTV